MTSRLEYQQEFSTIPRSFVAGGSETDDVSRDNVSQDRFSHKCSDIMGRVVPDNLF